ncbi:hypothetical protein PCANC_20447 [Puccinia coronata f. sp. avenae]|uniref:Uncharacterized protein n=1 Tax=Puccinia coronata f. sp. avenae TaxID=200324 RepID=A0A2N5SFP4_9BASI|nr:hypothetical protein PCANC_20447 [Puccinia coronata f. sp. avenae]
MNDVLRCLNLLLGGAPRRWPQSVETERSLGVKGWGDGLPGLQKRGTRRSHGERPTTSARLKGGVPVSPREKQRLLETIDSPQLNSSTPPYTLGNHQSSRKFFFHHPTHPGLESLPLTFRRGLVFIVPSVRPALFLFGSYSGPKLGGSSWRRENSVTNPHQASSGAGEVTSAPG